MPSLKNWSRRTLKTAGGKLLKAADRADERGGELRDRLQERLQNSERLAVLRKNWTKWSSSSEPQDKPERQPSVVRRIPQEPFSYGDDRKPAQIFGTRSCPWSGRAVRLFETAGIEATYLDLDHPGSGPIRDELRIETGQLTVPYVYLRGRFIGGFNALDEIQRLGQLDYQVLPKEERLAHPDHGKFAIAERVSSIDALGRPPE